MKTQKGITLVALVITIAIMLILAGVTISVSLKGGLFSKANEATSQMQIEAEKEELLTAALGTLGRNGKVDLTKLDSNLPNGFQKIGTGTYKSSTGNTYQVTEDADIILLDGTTEEPEIPDTPVVPPATPTITLSTTQITKEITKGTPETVQITATLNNASGDLTWQTSDSSIAEISGSGTTRTITLKKAGTAIITVSYGEVSATCNVTVTEKPISVVLDKETITEEIESGGTAAVTLTATLNNASGDLTWESSDEDVAEISGSGTTRTITLKKSGTATITVSYGTASDTCTITVTEKEAIVDDELAGTWVFNDTIVLQSDGTIYNLSFVSCYDTFSSIQFIYEEGPLSIFKYMYYDGVDVYDDDNSDWLNNSYKTIEISSKLSEVENGEEFLTWLRANAVKQDS